MADRPRGLRLHERAEALLRSRGKLAYSEEDYVLACEEVRAMGFDDDGNDDGVDPLYVQRITTAENLAEIDRLRADNAAVIHEAGAVFAQLKRRDGSLRPEFEQALRELGVLEEVMLQLGITEPEVSLADVEEEVDRILHSLGYDGLFAAIPGGIGKTPDDRAKIEALKEAVRRVGRPGQPRKERAS